MKTSKEKETTIDYQSELSQIFDKALKEVDSELLEVLDHVSILSTKDDTQMFQITTTHSGTIKENNVYAK